ncbi:MAG: 23S rRNA (pseudouridine(1915)-N(3))-methyltransferase RlmH [Coxiella sp. RIFCSPHIGHO2_12_FULL_42_15]|nr:MAG: 23S rRNA (pseudouridine(1915)-N(3))-methyltransferase RlmH [Coxiella sp. RIFCSPHIGHO2_12_FULL_42_15]
MKINLLAIGTKMPPWVSEGYAEYAKRLPKEFSLQLIEISAQKRSKSANIKQLLAIESEQLLATVPSHSVIITLDRLGKSLSTEQFAQKLWQFHQLSQDVSLLIGGPEGISPTVIQKANESWSLSALTLPHPVVRIVIAEQIYRAWSILSHHPYHR